jgi:hypothetical protein
MLPINALPELLQGLRDQFAGEVKDADGDEEDIGEAMTRLCRRVFHIRTYKGVAAAHIMQILVAVRAELEPFLPVEFIGEWPTYWRDVGKRYNIIAISFVLYMLSFQ